MDILDLGCGPGLYTERLHKKGHRVTGMDFSAPSIRYARGSAKNNGLDITYIRQDYLELAAVNKYDLILMIFTDFCVLNPGQRGQLLKRVRRALKAGGKFIFDVLNDKAFGKKAAQKDWQVSGPGFWREIPYLVLSDVFDYTNEKVRLAQHIIVDDRGSVDIYRFWHHHYSPSDLNDILMESGFTGVECHERVLPDSELYTGEEVTFCISTR